MTVRSALRTRRQNHAHRRIQVLLSDYLDGGLSVQQETLVESHARICERCRGVILSPPSATRMLRSIEHELPPNLVDGILARLASQEVSDLPVRERARPIAPASQDESHAVAEPKARQRLASARAAVLYCLRPSYLWRTLPIALLSGSVLTAMYEANDVLAGRADVATYLMCACNFLLAFVLVSLGPLVARSQGRRRRASDRATN